MITLTQGFDRRLRERLGRQDLPGLGFSLGFSTGLSTLERHDSGLESLLHRADTALYAAKDAGRGRMRAITAPSASRPPAVPRVPDTTV